jgi:cytoskeleton protein RodZ
MRSYDMKETLPTENIIPKERDISPKASPGIRLKRAREMAKLSIQVVARQLYLSENVITALEKDQYEKLPGLTFAKGYLRAYAKLLNISPDDVIQAFHELGLSEEPSAQFQVPLFKTQSNSLDRYIRWMTYGLAGVLILLFLMWWQSARKPLNANSDSQTVSSSTATSVSGTVNNPAGNVTDNNTGTLSSNALANVSENTSKNAAPSQQGISSLVLPSTHSSTTLLPTVKQDSKNSILPNTLSSESVSASSAAPASTSASTSTNNTINAAALPDSSSAATNVKSSRMVDAPVTNVAKKANSASDLSGTSNDAAALTSETHFPPDNSLVGNRTRTNATNQSATRKTSGQKKSSVVLTSPFE